jgi:hypothetical protein
MAILLHARSSMKTWGLLLLVVVGACAVEGDDVTDIEISATDPNGKADAIDGKHLRIRAQMRLSPWSADDAQSRKLSDLTTWKTVDIAGASSDRVMATGTFFGFDGTDQSQRLQHSPWVQDKLLSLGVEKRPGAQHRLGFVIRDALVSPGPYICARGDLRLNYFEELTINLEGREVYANGEHTFSFAECGIDPDGKRRQAVDGPDKDIPAWNFEVFVLPLATTGRLEGTYEYLLTAEVH